MITRLVDVWKKLLWLCRKDIWQSAHLKDNSPRGMFYAVLRVISITWTVFNETKAVSRAASLSFSSLLGLGPLIAIAVPVAGFLLDENDPSVAINSLNRLVTFVAPQISQLSRIEEREASATSAAATTPPNAAADHDKPPTDTPAVAASIDHPVLVELFNGFIAGARNGTAGAVGALTLIFIVLQLFTSVENAFNEIWGVRRGRTLLTRIVFYWTILTLGSILFFTAVTGLSAGAFFNAFEERFVFGAEVVAILRFFLPSISAVTLIVVLALFYRYIPNTKVLWRAAFVGAVVVALLLLLNNFLAFLYFKRVILNRSLWGSLGIPLVLMTGLYIFWLYVLIGGQISYAIQNVHFRNSQAAWSRLSEDKRERLSLILLLTICRRFHACLPPVSAAQLSTLMKVPTQIVNESLNRLVDMKLVTPIPPLPGADSAADLLYQPARPLGKINLLEFKVLNHSLGDDPVGNVEQLDPVVQHYVEAISKLSEQSFFQKSLEELMAEFPFDESRPPFATLRPR
jgi:membrane protein